MLLYVGWVRTGWTHWQAVTGEPMSKEAAEDRLRDYKVRKGEVDGSKVVLPAGTMPVEKPRDA